MTEIKWRTDKEYLKKISMLADVTQYAADDAEESDDIDAYNKCLLATRDLLGYFVHLTLKALKDRELGKHLIKVYDEIESKNFDGFFSGLERILLELHVPQGQVPKKKIESTIKAFENKNAIERAPEYLDKWLKLRKKRTRSSERGNNVMFA